MYCERSEKKYNSITKGHDHVCHINKISRKKGYYEGACASYGLFMALVAIQESGIIFFREVYNLIL